MSSSSVVRNLYPTGSEFSDGNAVDLSNGTTATVDACISREGERGREKRKTMAGENIYIQVSGDALWQAATGDLARKSGSPTLPAEAGGGRRRLQLIDELLERFV